MNAPILALDWIYIGTAQTLALAITNVGDYDFSTATVGVSTDGSQFQDTSALLEKTTTMGYKPVFPVYMGSEWLVPEGQKLYVNVLVGSESVQSEYTVHQAFPVQAKARTNTLSSSNLIQLQNLTKDMYIFQGEEGDTEALLAELQTKSGITQYNGRPTLDNYFMDDIDISSSQFPDITIPAQTEVTNLTVKALSTTMVYISFNAIQGLCGHKAYIRLSSNIPDDWSEYFYSYCMTSITDQTANSILLKNSLGVLSNIINVENDWELLGLGPYCGMGGEASSVSAPSNLADLYIKELVLIDITANQQTFTDLGLSTDEEIQSFLDGLTYDEINNGFEAGGDQPSGGLMYPENLVADITYGDGSSLDDYSINLVMAGSEDDYIPGAVGSNITEDLTASFFGYVIGDSDVISSCRAAVTLYYLAMMIGTTAFSSVSTHKIYIRFSSNLPEEWCDYLIMMGNAADVSNDSMITLSFNLKNNGSNLSAIGTLPDTTNCAWLTQNPRTLQFKTKTAPDIPDSSNVTEHYLNQAVLVDITANQDYFTAQGLATDEEIRAHLDSIPYSSFGQPATPIAPEPVGENKYVDGIGLGFLWEEMKDYIESQLSASGTILPIPLSSYELSDDKFSATIMLDITYTGYDSVTVRYKKGSEPSETDPEISQTEGVQVDDVGTYYIRAFGGSYTPSPSYKLNVTGLKVQTPVISIVQDDNTQDDEQEGGGGHAGGGSQLG